MRSAVQICPVLPNFRNPSLKHCSRIVDTLRRASPSLAKIISRKSFGAIAQLGERLPCTQEVCGSIPHSSTKFLNTSLQSSSCSELHFLTLRLVFRNLVFNRRLVEPQYRSVNVLKIHSMTVKPNDFRFVKSFRFAQSAKLFCSLTI